MIQEMAKALHLSPAIFSIVLISGLLLLALAAGFVLSRLFHESSRKAGTSWGHLLFALLEALSLPVLVVVALYGGLEVLPLSDRAENLGARLIRVLVTLVLFYFPAKVLIVFLQRLGHRDPGIGRMVQPASFATRVIFSLLAVVVALQNLGLHLTGLWTTLGVGSAAIALALQETLSNFFAGIYLMVDRPITPGDYIRVDPHEGFVVHIGWRSTTLRRGDNNLIFVPNGVMAKSAITNFSTPEPWMTVVVHVNVAYGSDARRVEAVLMNIAESAIREGLPGLLTNPKPAAALNPFGEFALDFSLIVHVRDLDARDSVQSELRKRILERFKQEGIEIPYPTRALLVDKEILGTLARGGPEK